MLNDIDIGYTDKDNKINITETPYSFEDFDMEAFSCIHTAGDENDVLLITGCQKCDYGTLHGDGDSTTAYFRGLDGIEIEEGLIESLGLGETITDTDIRINTPTITDTEIRINTPTITEETTQDFEMATETYRKSDTTKNPNVNDEQSKTKRSEPSDHTSADNAKCTTTNDKTKHHIPDDRRHIESIKMPVYRNEKRSKATADNTTTTGFGTDQNKDEYRLRLCIECSHRPALSRLADAEHRRVYIRVVEGSPDTREYKLITNFPMSIVRTRPTTNTRIKESDPNRRYPYWQDMEFYNRIRNYTFSKTFECSPHKQLKQLNITAKLIIKDIEYETENGPHKYDMKTRHKGPTPRHYTTAEQESWPQTYDSEFTVYIAMKYDLDLTSSNRIQQSQDLYKNFIEIADDKENSSEKLTEKLLRCYNTFHKDINNDLRKTITELRRKKEDNIKTEFNTKPSPESDKKKDFHKKASSDTNHSNNARDPTTSTKPKENMRSTSKTYTHPNAKYKHPYHPKRTMNTRTHNWKGSNPSTYRTTQNIHTHQNRYTTDANEYINNQPHYQQQHHQHQHQQERDGTTYHMNGHPFNQTNNRYSPYRRTLLEDPRPNQPPQPMNQQNSQNHRRIFHQRGNGTHFGNVNHQSFKMRTNRQTTSNNLNYNTDKSERRYKNDYKMQQ